MSNSADLKADVEALKKDIAEIKVRGEIESLKLQLAEMKKEVTDLKENQRKNAKEALKSIISDFLSKEWHIPNVYPKQYHTLRTYDAYKTATHSFVDDSALKSKTEVLENNVVEKGHRSSWPELLSKGPFLKEISIRESVSDWWYGSKYYGNIAEKERQEFDTAVNSIDQILPALEQQYKVPKELRFRNKILSAMSYIRSNL